MFYVVIGLLESAKAKKWLPEEQFEAFGDSVLGLTHGPCRGRERRMARVTLFLNTALLPCKADEKTL